MSRKYLHNFKVYCTAFLLALIFTGCDGMRNEESLKICFIRNGDVWVMNEDGSHLKQLTFTGNNEWPSWSSDGKYIVYEGLAGGHNEIFLMNNDGSNNRQLTLSGTDENCYCPTWMPDRNLIVYNRYVSSSTISYIGIMDTNGNIIQEYSLGPIGAKLDSLSVSYDNTMAAYLWGPPYIGILDFKNNSPNTTFISPTNSSVSWLPQKKILTYRQPSSNNILNRNIEEASPITILTGVPYPLTYGGLSWSPSGQVLCFTSGEMGLEGIYVYNFDAHELKRITSNINDKHPCFMGKPR